MRQLECLEEKRVTVDEVLEHAIARVCLCSSKWGVHGVVFELTSGRRTGCLLDEHEIPVVLTDQNIGISPWVSVEQPYGFLTKVSGYCHNQVGCLCHSIQLEFASGQVISTTSSTDSTNLHGLVCRQEFQGERFLTPRLPQNFLLNELVLGLGLCLGYTGVCLQCHASDSTRTRTSTDIDISQVLGWIPEESIPVEDWSQDPLRVRIIPDEEPKKDISKMIMKSICLADPQWQVDATVVTFYHGRIQGPLVVHNNRPYQIPKIIIDKQRHCRLRSNHYHKIQQPGGYLIRISGYQLIQKAQPPESTPTPQQQVAFHSLRLEFASGQILQYQPLLSNKTGRGHYFSYDIPDPKKLYVNQLVFWDGKLKAIGAVRTTQHTQHTLVNNALTNNKLKSKWKINSKFPWK